MNSFLLSLLVWIVLLLGTYGIMVLHHLLSPEPRSIAAAFILPIADALLLLRQEDLLPRRADFLLFRSAPFIALCVVALIALVIPLGPGLIGVNPSIGLCYFLVLLMPFV